MLVDFCLTCPSGDVSSLGDALGETLPILNPLIVEWLVIPLFLKGLKTVSGVVAFLTELL